MIFELPIAAADLAGNLLAPNRHYRDQFASGYPPVPTLITGYAALAAGDAVKFIVYHCRRRLSGRFPAPASFPRRGRAPQRVPLTESFISKPTLTSAVGAIAAGDSRAPGVVIRAFRMFSG